ncbi:torsin-1A-interacting protein 2-like isoform X1 [Polyodon spathula]|nr:torsin-1A-interacting protein 2-like isoform X1 [Polyodon spathula]
MAKTFKTRTSINDVTEEALSKTMSAHTQGKLFGDVTSRPSIKSYKTAERGAAKPASETDRGLTLAPSAAFFGEMCFSDTFPTETNASSFSLCEESNLPPNVNEEKSKLKSGNLNEWETNSEMVNTRSNTYDWDNKSCEQLNTQTRHSQTSNEEESKQGSVEKVQEAQIQHSDNIPNDPKQVVPPSNPTSRETVGREKTKPQGEANSSGSGSVEQPQASLVRSRNKKQTGPIKKVVPPSNPTSRETVGRGIYWLLLLVLVVALLVVAAFLHVYKPRPPATDENPVLQAFQTKFKELKSRFPSQREELWKRSKILLEKHLLSAQPSEPASMILTSGQNAHKTLHCLASQLAGVYSSALNASTVQMDGSGLASLDSDKVKLLLDEELKSSFEGNKRTAVIHQLEELPPGATLIFYKYCDHENAAYKAVSLIFTVLLEEEELTPGLNLGTVEEKVRDYIQKRFINSEQPDTFNKMDADKLGGLWSRISHLILPVTFEKDFEDHGCDSADSK